MSYGEQRLLVEFDSRFSEMEKGAGVEFISYQPFVLWPDYSNHKAKVTYYMAVYNKNNWRFNSAHRASGVQRLQYEKKKFRTSIVTDPDRKTDFLIAPSKKSATYFAQACDPPGGRNAYDGESWYRLDKSADSKYESREVLFKEDLSDMVVIKR
jgi:hypothetical protein